MLNFSDAFHFDVDQKIYLMLLIIFAGFPATTQFLGISFVTTEPAPITELSPIVTPGKTIAPAPIHTLLPMLILAPMVC